MSIPGMGKSYPYWPGTYPEASGGSVPASMPAGTIVQYAGSTAPSGWFLCNGANLLITSYPTLYSIFGNTYSAGGPAISPAITVGGTYSYTTTTITMSEKPEQQNTCINVGCIVNLAGAVAESGQTINGLNFVITSAPPIGGVNTGIPFVGTWLTPLSGSGSGSGGTVTMGRQSFQIPDTQGLVVRGSSGASPYELGQKGGGDSQILAPDNVPSHVHDLPTLLQSSEGGYGYGENGNVIGGPINFTGSTIYNSAGEQVTAEGQPGTAFSVVNSYITLNYIIKW